MTETTRRAWTGCGTALVTPFDEHGAVDLDTTHQLACRQVNAGVHFLAPCGTTGEAPTLRSDERVAVVRRVVEAAAGRVPVLAGAGAYDTAAACQAARDMQAAGADGLLVVTPYYNKPSQEGLFRHYAAIAETTPLPVVLYDVPGRTGCRLAVDTVVRLAELSTIVGVKHATGDVSAMSAVLDAVPDDFIVLSGDDALALPLMSVGGHGVISVVANEAPGDMARLIERAEAGDFATARTIHRRLFRLMTANFVESNPIPVKAAMASMGLLRCAYRLPLTPPSESARAHIAEALSLAGIATDGDES